MVKVEKFIPGGQALGTDESGKKIFFWNALPGELVTDCNVTKNKSHYLEAIATNYAHPSPSRVSPQDDCFLSTSPWQILDYDYELEQKSALITEIFREHQISIPTPEIITDGHDYHYRNKMEYALYWDNETDKISLAFHARGSHRKVPITKSSIERPEIFAAATKIVDDLNACHEEARKYQSLLLRCNQKGEVSGGLFENGKPHPVFPHLTDEILSHTYSYSPNGFFQINLPVYELALLTIKPHIITDKVLDLYSGVGTIGLSVAADKNLTLVECDKSAFSEMCKNISQSPNNNSAGAISSQRLQQGNILALLDKAENITDYISPDQTIILDPPRAGCDQKLLDRLLTVTPPKIVYLSCNPATQARDVKMLLPKYQIDFVQAFNFFPRTPHIENLVVMSRKKD